jgi:hypothetical protein
MSETNENFIDDNPVELPKLSTQQNLFVKHYAIDNMSGTEAYRLAYNSRGSTRSCCVEASRLLKNPNITLWIDFVQKTRKEHIRNEIKYSIDDAMKELDDLKIIALESLDQYSRPNISAATKAVEMKCKLKGLMSDDAAVNNSVVVQMGDVEVNGNPLELKIGDSIADDTSEQETDSCLQTSCHTGFTEEDSSSYIQPE